jgi:hypothetical protein
LVRTDWGKRKELVSYQAEARAAHMTMVACGTTHNRAMVSPASTGVERLAALRIWYR